MMLSISSSKNALLKATLLAVLIPHAWAYQQAMAQTVSIQGLITDGSSGESLEGANVTLQAISNEAFHGAATDRNGFYSITGVRQGDYAMQITYLGYTAYEDTLDLSIDPRFTVSIALQPDDEQLEDVVVSVHGGTTRQSVGRQRVRAIDLGRVPTPAGSGDLSTYLQTQPGVVAVGDRGGQLFIRGGTPSQNMVLIDGMLIYQPFHIVGFFSAFPQNLVSSADFLAGGFGARYSGRISSVIDVKMKDGHMYENKGSASVSPFIGEFMVEGPLKDGKVSLIASARHSLIESSSGLFMTEDQPLKFQSNFLKISHSGGDTRCSAMALHTYDRGRMDYQADDVIRWNNIVVGGRCLSLDERSGALMDARMSYSRIANRMDVGQSSIFSGVHRFTVDAHVTKPFEWITVGYGGYMMIKLIDYDIQEIFFTPQVEETMFSGGGGHFEGTIPIGGKFSIKPGIALNYFPNMYSFSVEPRFRAGWQPWGRDEEELSFAAGIYRQPLVGVADRRDVSAVFTAWMPSPVGDAQKESIHALLGWGQNLGGGFFWSLEGFYKRLRNQPITTWGTNAHFATDLSLAHGNVYGSDLRLEYNGRKIYGSFGYGYTWMIYQSAQESFSTWFGEPVQRFHPPHDRRHQINTQVSMDIGLYTAGMSWQLGTGLPYTQPFGFDSRLPFTAGGSLQPPSVQDNDPNTSRLPDVMNNYGVPRIILDKPYEARLPIYHRMDLSVGRLFRIRGAGLRAQVGAINLYDHSNIFYYDVYTHRRINQLSFAPYVSLKMEIN